MEAVLAVLLVIYASVSVLMVWAIQHIETTRPYLVSRNPEGFRWAKRWLPIFWLPFLSFGPVVAGCYLRYQRWRLRRRTRAAVRKLNKLIPGMGTTFLEMIDSD